MLVGGCFFQLSWYPIITYISFMFSNRYAREHVGGYTFLRVIRLHRPLNLQAILKLHTPSSVLKKPM